MPIPEASEKTSSFFSFINPKENTKGFLISILILIAFLALGVNISSQIDKTTRPVEKVSDDKLNSLSKNSVVYGYWMENNSKIEAVDLSSGQIYGLASLDKNIKKVTILTANDIIYINKTNDKDYGQEISTYNLNSKDANSLIKADSGFGIDDYVISPNKRYLATWEIQVSVDAQQLIGGVSRVYAVDLRNPNQKNLIFNEPIQEGASVNYPLAITDNGTLYMDKFKANYGAGWANGMSVSNLSGSQKQPLSSMTAGTYSTQPVLSSDGKYLVFAGYDGSRGSGVSIDAKQGFNQAFLNPNTIEILDTSTNQRQKLSNLSNVDRYAEISWDKGNIIFLLTSKDSSSNGYYLYNISSSTFTKIMNSSSDIGLSIISALEENKLLAGKADPSISSTGNLGKNYSPSLREIMVYNYPGGKQSKIEINKALFQFIDILPSGYFNNSLAIGKAAEGKERRQLQLEALVMKPALGPNRTIQQSDFLPTKEKEREEPSSRCRDLGAAQCNALLGTNYKPEGRNSTGNGEYDKCYHNTFYELKRAGACMDSPLYLYGRKDMKVEIKIGTEIFNAIPDYKNGYNVVLGENGKFYVGNLIYSNIFFDYRPALRRIPYLDYGRVVKLSDMSLILDEYGRKLELNTSEINDLKASVSDQIDSPYVLISFYDDETSRKILPMSFIPEPDVYRNIVFYFKSLNAPMSIREPKFENIPERVGFTAVEISHIIE